MPETVKVEVREVEEALGRLEHAISPGSLDEFLRSSVVGYLHQEAESRFNKQGDAGTGSWPGLSPWTIAERERLGYPSGPPNVRSGSLHAFITGSQGNTSLAGDGAELTYPGGGGTTLEAKLSMAQQGIDPNPYPGAAPVPPRPVVNLAEKDAPQIVALLSTWVTARMRAGI